MPTTAKPVKKKPARKAPKAKQRPRSKSREHKKQKKQQSQQKLTGDFLQFLSEHRQALEGGTVAIAAMLTALYGISQKTARRKLDVEAEKEIRAMREDRKMQREKRKAEGYKHYTVKRART